MRQQECRVHSCVLISVHAASALARPYSRCEYSRPHLQVNIEKPMGIRFARGNDGAAYVLKSDPRAGNTDDRVEVTAV